MRKTLLLVSACLVLCTLASPNQTASAQTAKAISKNKHVAQANQAWRETIRAIQELPTAQQPDALVAALRNNTDLLSNKRTSRSSKLPNLPSVLARINRLPEQERVSALYDYLKENKIHKAAGRSLPKANAAKAGIRSESEPNESSATANIISTNQLIAGRASSGTDQDWFTFTANAGDILDAFVFAEEFGSTFDGYMVLYASDGRTVLAANDDYELRDPRVLHKLPNSGIYYLQLTAFDAEALGDYELSLSILGNSQESEPNNGIGTASISNALPYAAIGEIDQTNDNDFYAITVAPGDVVGIRLESVTGDAQPDMVLAIYDAAGSLITVNDDHLGGRYFNSELSLKNRSGQNAVYYLQATTYQNQEAGQYIISVRKIATAPPGTFYAALGDSGGGRFMSLNATNGQSEMLGFSRFHGISALAVNNFGEIFGIRSKAEDTPVFRIDPLTGNGYGVATIFGLTDVYAITFDSQDRMYALNSLNELHLINFGSSSSSKVFGLTVHNDLAEGMAFDPKTGNLYLARGSEIWRTNLGNGIQLPVGNSGLAEPVSELFFDHDGNLYGIRGGLDQNNALVSINKNTGAATAIGQTSFVGIEGAVASVRHALDVKLDAIVSPATNPPFGATEKVSVSLTNLGTIYRSGLPVGYRLQGPFGTTASENTGSVVILPGQQSKFNFQKTIDMRATGQYKLDVYVSASGDVNSTNDTLSITIQNGVSAIGDEDAVPSSFAMHQNYPNPFNPETSIAFDLPIASRVRLTLYNAIGQKVRTLLADYFAAGRHSAKWDGKDDHGIAAPSGLYFYKIQAGDFAAMKKLILMR